jgi:hypothetical protein
MEYDEAGAKNSSGTSMHRDLSKLIEAKVKSLSSKICMYIYRPKYEHRFKTFKVI